MSKTNENIKIIETGTNIITLMPELSLFITSLKTYKNINPIIPGKITNEDIIRIARENNDLK